MTNEEAHFSPICPILHIKFLLVEHLLTTSQSVVITTSQTVRRLSQNNSTIGVSTADNITRTSHPTTRTSTAGVKITVSVGESAVRGLRDITGNELRRRDG